MTGRSIFNDRACQLRGDWLSYDEGFMLPTVEWQDGIVVMVDQRKLPAQEVYVHCRAAKDVMRAIKTMVVRGAPAIGVAAAMGLALGVSRSSACRGIL